VSPTHISRTFSISFPALIDWATYIGNPYGGDNPAEHTLEYAASVASKVTQAFLVNAYEVDNGLPPAPSAVTYTVTQDEEGNDILTQDVLDSQMVSPDDVQLAIQQSDFGVKVTAQLCEPPGPGGGGVGLGTLPPTEAIHSGGSGLGNNFQIDIWVYPTPNGILNPGIYGVGDGTQVIADTLNHGTDADLEKAVSTPNRTASVPSPDGGSGGGSGQRPAAPTGGGGGILTPTEYIWLEMSPNPMAFVDTCVGGFETQGFTVTNKGTKEVTIPTLADPSQTIFSIIADENITLGANDSATGFVWFLPPAEDTYTYTGEISDGTDSLLEFSISGSGIDCTPVVPVVKELILTGDIAGVGDINFLEVPTGSTATRSVLCTNVGNVPVSVSSAALHTGDPEFVITNDAFTLDVGESKGIPITFTPSDDLNFEAILKTGTDSETALDGYLYFTVYGAGYSTPTPLTREIRFDGAPLSFGGILLSEFRDLAITISSVGTGAVLVASISVPKPFYLSTTDARFTLATASDGATTLNAIDVLQVIEPGTSTAPITVRFAPETAGEFLESILASVIVTAGPTSTTAEGTGVFDIPPEIDPGPDPVPDDDPASDPPSAGDSALDGVGSSCIQKPCEIPYLYEHDSTKEQT
jgi:hypothetical protein